MSEKLLVLSLAVFLVNVFFSCGFFFSSVITLMEADILVDDFVGEPQTFKLNGLELDKVYQETFVFREVFNCLGF